MGSEDSATTPANTVTDVPSDLELKIIRQIEYYFGDFNMSKDRFLQEQVKADEGWIPLDTMVKFNRLKELSTDFDVIGTALKKSPSHLMEVSEDGKKIRRNPEKPPPENTDENKSDINERSVYAKSFPITTTLDTLLEFFKKFGNVVNVFMKKKKPKKLFKGSVFVTFATKAEAAEFLKLESVKFNGVELFREAKDDYTKRKQMEFQKRVEEREKLKAQRIIREAEADDDNNDDDKQETEESFKKKGCLLMLTGLSENTMWEDIKSTFNPHEQVAYVDHFKGKPEAVIRFMEGNAANALEKALSGEEDNKKLIICEKEVTAKILEGEEEQEYWKICLKDKLRKKQQKMRGRKFKRGYGRQGRGAMKRPAEDAPTDEIPSKQMKSDNVDEN